MLNLVLFQPDIPQNLGACLRLSACLGCRVHVVEPCGFPFDHAKLRRAGMDYIGKAEYIRHLNWDAFLEYREKEASRASAALSPRLERSERGDSSMNTKPTGAERSPAGDLAGQIEKPGRLLLLETDGDTNYTAFDYRPSDYIIVGSEGAGTPRALYEQMDAVLTIPMRQGVRSLNMAMSAGILVAEACRQKDWNFA